jgi:hypothetical protein
MDNIVEDADRIGEDMAKITWNYKARDNTNNIKGQTIFEVGTRVISRPDFFPDCPDFICPVRNKVNTNSGRRRARKLYILQNF